MDLIKKYFSNFILCGEVDYLCLLCDEGFRNLEDIDRHILWQEHRRKKNSKERVFLPRLKKEQIYKFYEMYYCSTCNYISDDKEKIQAHATGTRHEKLKKNPNLFEKEIYPIRKEDRILIGDLSLTKREWHGVNDDMTMCWICKKSFNNVLIHMISINHTINLIKTRVKKDPDNEHYYRKIDDDSIQCFNCKKTFPDLSNHNEVFKNEQLALLKEQEIKRNLNKYLAQPFDQDYKNATSTCRICGTSVNMSYAAMICHFNDVHEEFIRNEPHNYNSEAEFNPEESSFAIANRAAKSRLNFVLYMDHGKRRSELAKYGRENHIKLNQGGSLGRCNLCDVNISPHLSNFKQHVEGSLHRSNLEFKADTERSELGSSDSHNRTRSLMYYFHREIKCSEYVMYGSNSLLHVDKFSFLFLCPIVVQGAEFKTKCFVCSDCMKENDVAAHILSDEHIKHMYYSREVIEKDIAHEEFVREIRHDVYHCGHCNLVYPFRDTLMKHFTGWRHRSAKISIKEPSYRPLEPVVDIVMSSTFQKSLDELLAKLFEMFIENPNPFK